MYSIPYVFGIGFTLCSFLFFLLLVIVYLRKNAKYNMKNFIFRRILYFGIFGFLFEFLFLFVLYFSDSHLLVGLSKKFTFLCFLACMILWSYYMVIVIFEKNQSISRKLHENNFNIDIFLLSFLGVVGLTTLLLPAEFAVSESGNIQYMYGVSNTFLYVVFLLVSFVPIPCILMQHKDLSFKGLFPYFFVLCLEIIALIITHFIPELCFIGFVLTMSVYMIYYRMENPDLFMIRRFKANSDRVKYLRERFGFLFNMSPELRELLNEVAIMKDNYLLDEKKSIDKKKLEALILDFVSSSEAGKTIQKRVDDDGIEILDLDDDSNDEMLVTKEIYSLNEIKKILEEDNLPKW